MVHQSLYRRYRSRRFSEVKGQPHVVNALRNAVREQRWGHAYLFSGPRGTGKTSTARILAKALNCENLTDGEPCSACPSCLAIEKGASYDLQELDAASNNKVEDVRELISKVALGSPGRVKVYILDEVHMLSTAASNALLKTLEEPPPHVVFVLATTDPHKVLPTIRSRTQHFEFNLLPADVMEEHVRWVIADAGLEVGDDVVDHVLRVGGGSARDTLSALDQVVAAGGVSGGTEPVERLVDAVVGSDTGAALRAVSDAVAAGRDPRVLGEALLARLRDVFLLRMGAEVPHLPEGDRQLALRWAEQITDRAATRALEAVGAALLEMRQAPDTRIPLEVALVRITRSDADPSTDGLLARIERLEGMLAAGGGPSPATVTAPAAAVTPTAPTSSDMSGAPGQTKTQSGRVNPSPAPTRSATPATPERSPTPESVQTSPSASEPQRSTGAVTAPEPVPDVQTDPPGSVTGAAGARAALASHRAASRRTGNRGNTGGADAQGSPRSASPPPPQPGRGGERPTIGTPVARAAADAPSEADTQPPVPTTSPGPDPVPTAAGGPQDGGSAFPDRDELTVGWADNVLPTLSGLTKAMFAAGRFTAVENGTAVFALPNEVHRQKCDAKRAEVEKAMAKHFGKKIPLRLAVDAGVPGFDDAGEPSNPGRDAGREPAPGGPQADSSGSADDEVIDVNDLVDAPADPRTHLDRLTEAFPGAQLLEEDR